MRVLLADGDAVLLEVAQCYLARDGHEVNTATSGLETVASLRRDLPDVVVLDRELRWGGSDGVRALMQQDPRWSEIPVILTSDNVMPDESSSTASPSLAARLQKPYRLIDLVGRLHACSLNGTPSPLLVVVQGGRP